ncbi:MAG: RDD family protein [Solirubrobacterales bacterium]|nr:RDD family protein [Solirubrobacterales bacterium]
MDLDESITIATPEGIELRLQLAGLGSRFIAGGVDLVIMLILLGILAVITGPVAGMSGGVAGVVFVIGSFVILLFYPILFELLAGGQTPGKRMSHLRVLRDSGAPVDLPASAIRNLMRLVDGPLLLYLPSIVGIAVTKRNQRPGDIAAGTIVTREQPAAKAPRKAKTTSSASAAPAGVGVGLGARARAGEGAGEPGERWDTSAVTPQEVAAVRRFLERRASLERAARRELAVRLADGLRSKVTSASAELAPEQFLEELERIKRTL